MTTPLLPSSAPRLASLPSILAAAALVLSACPGDDVMQEGSSGTEDTGTSTTTTTTLPPPGNTTTTTTDPDTSTTTIDPDTSTTLPPGTESSSSDDGTTGDQPGSGYADCANDDMACTANEICLQGGIYGSCAEQSCSSVADCDVPASGDADIMCEDIDMSGSTDCWLDCSAGQTCPDGMECAFDFICLWPLLPEGGGVCPDEVVDTMMLPQVIMGDNTGFFDDVVPTCGGGGGEDFLYEFTAPADDTYVFDTIGTVFDTTLSINDGCDGAELACNDDINMELNSEVSVDLMMGQTVIVVVDSFDGAVGPFTLNIAPFVPGACPDQDLGNTSPQMTMGDNTGLVDDVAPTCAPTGEDALFQFTAPVAGMYTIDTAGSAIDTVLSVLDGCGGMELACNDDTGMVLTSEVVVDLMMDQSIIIAVDGFGNETGPFNLNITGP